MRQNWPKIVSKSLYVHSGRTLCCGPLRFLCSVSVALSSNDLPQPLQVSPLWTLVAFLPPCTGVRAIAMATDGGPAALGDFVNFA